MKGKYPTYFISGHREIAKEEFERLYIPAIDDVINNVPTAMFYIGDYWGVDKMAQDYLVEKGYASRVCVFHMFEKPRYFNDKIKATLGGFTTDEERDSAMTRWSDYDIAFVRKGKWNSGTAQNIKRRHQFE